MPTALAASCLLSTALFLAGGEGTPEAKAPPAARPAGAPAPRSSRPESMVRRIYAVADLVVPVGQGLGDNREAAGELMHGVLEDLNRGITAKRGQDGPSGKTTEALLMKLIRTTVAPASWCASGGRGTMEFYPLGMGLVVTNTPAVQEEVADLLAALRRLQDVEVAVEVRLVSVPEVSLVERIGLEVELSADAGEATSVQPRKVVLAAGTSVFDEVQGATLLDEGQVRRVLEAVQGDRGCVVLQAPRVTVFNGQSATVDATREQHFVTELKVQCVGDQVVVLPRNETFRTGFCFGVRPVVSADRRSVALEVNARLTDLASAAVPTVPVITHLAVRTDKDGREQMVPVRQFVQQPSFHTLALHKSFSVADGKTAVLRWGTRPEEGRTESGSVPPVLSRVPYLNRLFVNVGYGREAHDIFLLITPRVIVNAGEEQQAPPPPEASPASAH